MLVTQIIGGLGNQMFQYAAARSLSLKRNAPLRLDVSAFSSYGLHQGFEINRVFNCNAEISSEQDTKKILGWQICAPARRVLVRSSMRMFRSNALVVEPYFEYWPGIDHVAPECYLIGYWQSEKYFSNYADQIRNDFTFQIPISQINEEVQARILAVNAVSLHIRRGDYVNDAKTNATHGSCPIGYYVQAIEYITDRIPVAHFFLFSDDINWAKANLKINNPVEYISHNQGAESYNDMRLMSFCKHHIIANSSFSWWGAWLNARTDKLVIAPKRWFRNQTNVTDLIPPGWVRL